MFILLYPFFEFTAWWYLIDRFGFGDAVLWCLLSAFVGILILKLQGGGIAQELSSGGAPSLRVVHRFLILLGAGLLILPGVLTDVAGVLLILPGLRHLLVWVLMAKLVTMIHKGSGMFGTFVFSKGFGASPGAGVAQSSERDVSPIQVSGTRISSQSADE